MVASKGKLRITWVKSAIGYKKNQKATVAALGLRKLGQSIEHDDTPQVRGMVFAVRHLVKMEEAKSGS
ncbi:MAG: 50S ribosomal protein L30 [Chloroflexota bacterium]|nr:50S ribosomal protein L30 [Chloroflexota bacterium]